MESADYQNGFKAGIEAFGAHVLTTPELAKELRLSSQRIRQLAVKLGLGTNVNTGRGSIWLFTPKDVATLKARSRAS